MSHQTTIKKARCLYICFQAEVLSMTEYRIVLTTCPKENAPELAKQLVESRYCACANIINNVESIYHWKGDIEQATESIILMKTHEKSVALLHEELRKYHTYDVPEFIVIQITWGASSYLHWISESVKL